MARRVARAKTGVHCRGGFPLGREGKGSGPSGTSNCQWSIPLGGMQTLLLPMAPYKKIQKNS